MIFKRQKNDSHKNDFWIGFSDLMTGLMLVFIVLSLTFIAIAKQRIDEAEEAKERIVKLLEESEKAKERIAKLLEESEKDKERMAKLIKEAEEQKKELERRRKNIIVILSEKLATDNIKFEYNEEKGTVTIAQDILFARKESRLNPKGQDFIKLFAKILDNNIFNDDKYKDLIKYVHIEGYASKEGSAEHNFKLSYERAKNVWAFMTSTTLRKTDTMKKKLNIVSRGEIDANQVTIDTSDRKVIFRFEFYDTYNKIFDRLSR